MNQEQREEQVNDLAHEIYRIAMYGDRGNERGMFDAIRVALVESLVAQAAQQANPWKDAVLDALADAHMDAPMDEEPRSILKRVIACNVATALDPAVSEGARLLVARGAAQQAEPEWRGIESAPKDGTVLLGWIVAEANEYSEGFESASLIHWDKGFTSSICDRKPRWIAHWRGEPTHWVPLPAPPVVGDPSSTEQEDGRDSATSTEGSKNG